MRERCKDGVYSGKPVKMLSTRVIRYASIACGPFHDILAYQLHNEQLVSFSLTSLNYNYIAYMMLPVEKLDELLSIYRVLCNISKVDRGRAYSVKFTWCSRGKAI